MQLLSSERSLFVLIDVQGKLTRMVFEPDRLLEGCRRFLEIAEIFQRPLILTEQYPAGLGPTEAGLLKAFGQLTTKTKSVAKDSFGCCGEPSFARAIDALLPDVPVAERQFVLAGMETHICVMQTALELLGQGSKVFVPFDCVSGRGARYNHWGLERLQQAGAVVTNHESIAFELAGDKNHSGFKRVSSLLKSGQPQTAS